METDHFNRFTHAGRDKQGPEEADVEVDKKSGGEAKSAPDSRRQSGAKESVKNVAEGSEDGECVIYKSANCVPSL